MSSNLARPFGLDDVGASVAPTQVLYLQEQGDTSAISVGDIHQGQIGDCFLLSAIGEIALFHPTAIASMIHANANGTETVTLYTDSRGNFPGIGTTAFKAEQVTVTNQFASNGVNNGANQDVSGSQKEIWPQVLEKAYAQAHGGYGAIASGGSPVLAMEMLTGHTATYQSAQSLTVSMLQADVAAGDLIVMDTAAAGNAQFNLVGNHAYMFKSLTMVGGTPTVTLLNPWGMDQPNMIPLSQLSKGIVEVDVGRFA